MSKELEFTVDQTEAPKGNGGVFFKKPAKGKYYLRFYPCISDEGKVELGKHIKTHWVDGKNFPCTAPDCQRCKDNVKVTLRSRVGCVDMSLKEDKKMQLYDMPISLWGKLKVDIDENGKGSIGDNGQAYCLTFDPTKDGTEQYALTLARKDKGVLDFGKKLLSFTPQTDADKINMPPVSQEETGEVFDVADAPTESKELEEHSFDDLADLDDLA